MGKLALQTAQICGDPGLDEKSESGRGEPVVDFIAPPALPERAADELRQVWFVEAIANGSAPADLTVSSLARALPHSWAAQEHKLGIT